MEAGSFNHKYNTNQSSFLQNASESMQPPASELEADRATLPKSLRQPPQLAEPAETIASSPQVARKYQEGSSPVATLTEELDQTPLLDDLLGFQLNQFSDELRIDESAANMPQVGEFQHHHIYSRPGAASPSKVAKAASLTA